MCKKCETKGCENTVFTNHPNSKYCKQCILDRQRKQKLEYYHKNKEELLRKKKERYGKLKEESETDIEDIEETEDYISSLLGNREADAE